MHVFHLFLIALSFIVLSANANAERSYIKCWKNAQGLTECGNRVPRQYYSQRIEYIDDKGITRKVKERAKTQEEKEAEIELAKLKKLEAEQLKQAREYDSVLLKTYLTIDDLLASLNSKINIIESRGKVLESTLELKKREFGALVRKAANLERSGKNIDAKLSKQLDSKRKELRNLQAQINSEQSNRENIQAKFAHDVERFMLSKTDRIKQSLTIPSQAQKLHAARVSCLSDIQCQSHWNKANDFITQFSTREILYQTDRITVTDIPYKARDISMGLAMLNVKEDEKKKLIILQIRCKANREGEEFCDSDEISGLLKEFKAIIYSEKISQ
jgi:hypothetical protein